MKEINIRRSIRKFTNEQVSKEQVERLLRAAMQAPSAGNQQPWEFLVIEDKDMLEAVSKMSPYSAMVKHSAVTFIFLGNKERMKYPENWEQDMAAATENLLLEAVSIGLGGVWLGGAPLEDRMNYISDLFDLPKHVELFSVVPIGHPAAENKFVDRFDESRIHFEKY